MPDMKKVQQLLQDRKSPKSSSRASAPFPIVMDSDLAVDLSHARQALAEAQQDMENWATEAAADSRQGGKRKPPADKEQAVADAQTRVEELEAEAKDVTVTLVFVALTANDQDALIKQHPPRPDNDEDAKYGYDVTTFPIARMRECAAKVIGDNDEELDVDIPDLIAGLQPMERDFACQVVNGISAQAWSVPFYAANSQSRQRSGGKSRRP